MVVTQAIYQELQTILTDTSKMAREIGIFDETIKFIKIAHDIIHFALFQREHWIY